VVLDVVRQPLRNLIYLGFYAALLLVNHLQRKENHMQNRYTEPKPKHGSQEWLTARWKNKEGYTRVTASVAAVVHNEHKYTTPADLAVELLSLTPPAPKEQNDAMRRGTILEEPLLRWASEILGKPITEPHVLYAYDEDGVRLLSTIDGMDPLGEVYELKTYNKRWQGQ